jgi:hypothetical protein
MLATISSKQNMNTMTSFKDLCLEAKAITWP